MWVRHHQFPQHARDFSKQNRQQLVLRHRQCSSLSVGPTQHSAVLDEERGVHVQGDAIHLIGLFCRLAIGGYSGSLVVPHIINVTLFQCPPSPQGSIRTSNEFLGCGKADVLNQLKSNRFLLLPRQIDLLAFKHIFGCSVQCRNLLDFLRGPSGAQHRPAQLLLSMLQRRGG